MMTPLLDPARTGMVWQMDMTVRTAHLTIPVSWYTCGSRSDTSVRCASRFDGLKQRDLLHIILCKHECQVSRWLVTNDSPSLESFLRHYYTVTSIKHGNS